MSRKPTVVSLSETDAEKPDVKAKPKPAAKSKPAPRKENASRKPRALKAPDQPETEDYFETEYATAESSVPSHLPRSTRRSRWGAVFFASILALVTLGLGLWITQTIEGLFARNEWLGWAASGLLALALASLFVVVLREILALWRLRKLERLREGVMAAMESNSQEATKILDQIVGLYTSRKEMEWHISRLASHKDDVMDGRDRLLLAERYLMKPLDDEAKQIIASAAKRISVVTAVNPAPSLDVIFTGYQVLRMLRQLTALYGNRPGSFGTLRLAGMVGSHLAVTGGLALSDTFIQQFLGKGLAGRLSAKLGEGTVNGIMTARIGLAAMDLCRPMPFNELAHPGLKEFIATLAGSFTTSTPSEPKD